jgi:hypothetical protein
MRNLFSGALIAAGLILANVSVASALPGSRTIATPESLIHKVQNGWSCYSEGPGHQFCCYWRNGQIDRRTCHRRR